MKNRIPIVPITIGVIALQVLVLIISTLVYPQDQRLPWLPLAEAIIPWVLLPLVRIKVRPLVQAITANSKSMVVLGEFFTLVPLVVLGILLAFQTLAWLTMGKFHGGIFYLGSTYLVLLWGLGERKSP